MKYFLLLIFLISQYSFSENKNEALDYLKKMSLKEKVEQVFIFNVYKNKFDNTFKSILKKHRSGSYILFGKDIPSAQSLYNLTHKLQKDYIDNTGLPPLIMIDQEGGHVTRINTKPNLPSPLAVSMSGDPSLSYNAGSEIAKILRLLGINMNLAPVVDLSDPFVKNFIGNRSFGNDPESVVQFASTQALAYEEQSIIPTFKHFPGHGGVIQDSHKKLPKKLSSLEELKNHDLKPFSRLINKHPEAAILIGHLAFPNIDTSGKPATFSKILLTNLLKNELNFKGLVITDDLQMKALKSYGSLLTRSQLAFNAGSDLLMVTGGYRLQRKLVRGFIKLVKQNKISEDRLNETVLKVINAKLKVKNNVKEIKDFKLVFSDVKKHIKKLKQSTDTIINNNLKKSMNDIVIALNNDLEKASKVKVFSAYKSFYAQIKSKFPKKKFNHHYLSSKRGLSSSQFASLKTNNINIFYATGLGSIRLLKRLTKNAKKNTIVINSTHPGALPNQSHYKNVINLNTPYSYSGKLFANLIKAKGRMVQ